MLKNANILMIRHAEKPDSGSGLSVAGYERAQAYSVYFRNYMIDGDCIKLDYLFAADDSKHSHRPYLTIEPLSKAEGLKIDEKYRDKEYRKAAKHIRHHAKYHGSNILICWHHGEILKLAEALGVDASKLPSESRWPSSWPEDVYGWLLQLCYDDQGNIIPLQTCCINEQLMHGGFGKNPPQD